MSSDNKISPIEAYQAMLFFLEEVYRMTRSDDLAGFLGGWQLTSEGKTMDPAAWQDWLRALEVIKKDTRS